MILEGTLREAKVQLSSVNIVKNIMVVVETSIDDRNDFTISLTQGLDRF